jgi:hypothetical protein
MILIMRNLDQNNADPSSSVVKTCACGHFQGWHSEGEGKCLACQCRKFSHDQSVQPAQALRASPAK